MKICYFEDKGNAAQFAMFIADLGHTVEIMHDYRDLAQKIAFEPDYYDILIMDLILDAQDAGNLKSVLACKDYDPKVDLSPTICFVNKFLLNRFERYHDRLIFVSAYINDLKKKPGYRRQFNGFETINKSADDASILVLAKLDAIARRYNLH